jgi:hypothetical protein
MLRTRVAPPLLTVLAIVVMACASNRPAAPGLPAPASLVELQLTPSRDVAAFTVDRDTTWLRDAAKLTGRVVGGNADSLDFAPGELYRADGTHDRNLPRGLLVRLPRDPASGIAVHVVTHDTRPAVGVFTTVLVVAAAFVFYLSIMPREGT